MEKSVPDTPNELVFSFLTLTVFARGGVVSLLIVAVAWRGLGMNWWNIMMSRYIFTRRGMSLSALTFALRERERKCNGSAGLQNVWTRDLSTFLGRSLRRVLFFDRLHRFEDGALGGTIPFGRKCDLPQK
jgi:hypothetical protein